MSYSTCRAKSPKTCRCPSKEYMWERKFEQQLYDAKTPAAREAIKAQLDEMWREYDEKRAQRQMFYKREVAHLNFKRVNPETEHFYTRGECFLFALAASEQTGLPMVLWNTDTSDGEHGGWQGHVALRYKDGFIDATGFFKEEALAERYEPLTRSPLEGKDLIKHVVFWDFFVDEPWKAPGERARELTNQYVKAVLRTVPGLKR